jgi:hypothetical protein
MNRKKESFGSPFFNDLLFPLLGQLDSASSAFGSDGWILLYNGDGYLIHTLELLKNGSAYPTTYMFHKLRGNLHLLLHHIEDLGIVNCIREMI